MDIQNEYKIIQSQIEAFAKEVDLAVSKDTEIQGYHQGWRVFFSPVVHKPKVLLIGINPGAGQAGVKDFEFWDGSEQFEYTNPKYNFALARETTDAFNQAGLADVLKNSTVKTNYFFLSTTSEKDLYKITDYLGRGSDEHGEKLGESIFTKAGTWTKKLIELIQPEVIVCEGKEAYQNVTDLFPDYGDYAEWQDGVAYTAVPANNLVIIGYSRLFSNIKDKAALAALLKKFVKV